MTPAGASTQYKASSNPVVGDNEYVGKDCSTPGAEGYYTYFGDRVSPQEPGCTINCKGYYRYDVGSWHMVALNSECDQPGVLHRPLQRWRRCPAGRPLAHL